MLGSKILPRLFVIFSLLKKIQWNPELQLNFTFFSLPLSTPDFFWGLLLHTSHLQPTTYRDEELRTKGRRTARSFGYENNSDRLVCLGKGGFKPYLDNIESEV